MKFLVVVRRTEKWNELTSREMCDKIREQAPVRRPVITDLFFEGVELWDKECSISFCEYRQILWEIAQESWQKAGLEWIEFQDFQSLPKDDDLILLPTDDDDVYAPFIKRVLENHFSGMDGLKWSPVRYFPITNNISSFDNGIVGTNSYALRSTAVFNRGQITAHSQGFYNLEKTKHLDMCLSLSLSIRHPASISFLEGVVEDNKSRSADLPRWFQETADRLHNLTVNLGLSKL